MVSAQSSCGELSPMPRARAAHRTSGHYDVLDVWNQVGKTPSKVNPSLSRAHTSVKIFALEGGLVKLDEDEMADASDGDGRCSLQMVPLHPNSLLRAAWDVVSLLLVAYDFCVLPLMLLDPPENTSQQVMTWVTRLYWSFDISMSCLTGNFKPDGFVEMRLMRVLSRYGKSWFIFDGVFVSLDWMEVILLAGETSGARHVGMMRMLRTVRMLRMVRLLRVVRALNVVALLTERAQSSSSSEAVLIGVDIAQIVVVLLALAHIIACAWYGVGRMGSGWLGEFGYGPDRLSSSYAMAFHWSLSQFSGGMDEITAQTDPERVYTIGAILFGTIISASLVSSLTTSLTKLTLLRSSKASAFSALRRYLQDCAPHGISPNLRLRIQRNAQHAYIEQQRFISETQVEMLQEVSEPLLVELHYEIFAPILETHPFFRRYCLENPPVMRKVCHGAVRWKSFHPGDVLFTRGEIPHPAVMFFIQSGSLAYTRDTGLCTVECGAWACEGTLWTSWTHTGTLQSTSNCRVLELEAESFQRIAGHFVSQEFSPQSYAVKYIQAMNEDDDVSDIGDQVLCDRVVQELCGDHPYISS